MGQRSFREDFMPHTSEGAKVVYYRWEGLGEDQREARARSWARQLMHCLQHERTPGNHRDLHTQQANNFLIYEMVLFIPLIAKCVSAILKKNAYVLAKADFHAKINT
jgi:hypothetical protein